jgi:hypothetical protein
MELAELLAALELTGLDADPAELADVWWLAALCGDPRAAGSGFGHDGFAALAHAIGAQTESLSERAIARSGGPAGDRDRDRKRNRNRQDDPETLPGDPGSAEGNRRTTESEDPGLAGRPSVGEPGSAAGPDRSPVLDQRAVIRALRPFKCRVERGPALVLDEAATAEATAGAGVLVPVLRPRSERRFRGRIVVDRSESMELWAAEQAAFETAVAAAGVFRHLTSIGFIPAPGARFPADRDPDTVHLVVTDGIAGYWSGAGAADTWCRLPRAALVQPLPERLWERTSLAPRPGVFRALPGRPRLRFQPLGRGEWRPARSAGVPFLELTGERIGTWARLVAGWDRAMPGTGHLPASAEDVASLGLGSGESVALRPADLWARFAAGSSRQARQLALRLAVSGAVVTVPAALRLLRSLPFPTSVEHVVEVLYGGLLDRRAEPDRFGDIVFEYPAPLRAYLADFTPAGSGLAAFEIEMEYTARNLGMNTVSKASLPIYESQQLGQAKRALARRLGGVVAARDDDAEMFGKLADRTPDTDLASGFRKLAAAAGGDAPRDVARRADRELGLDALGRFRDGGDRAHLDQAIDALRRAGPPWLDLAETLLLRASHPRDEDAQAADAEEAVALYREILSAEPVEQPERVVPGAVRASLAAGTTARRVADLDRAVGLARGALRDVPSTDPGFPERAGLLGAALRQRYEVTKAPADLDEALVFWQQAARAAVLDTELFWTLIGRASALEARFMRTGAVPDLMSAAECYQQAARIEGVPEFEHATALAGLARTLLGGGFALRGSRAAREALAIFERLGEYRHPDATALRQLMGMSGSERESGH